MAFSTVEGTNVSLEGADTLTHDIVMPAGLTILLNDIILVFCGVNGTPTITAPTNYTKLIDASNSTPNTKLVVFYKRAAGSEVATTYSTSVTEQSANRTFVIRGAHTTSAPEAGVVATGSSLVPNPPSLNPVGWDVEDTLFFACCAVVHHTATLTAGPANYTNLTSDASAATGNLVASNVGTARRNLTAASDDPGTFTIGGATARSWAAQTVAIRPAPVTAVVYPDIYYPPTDLVPY